MAFPADLSDVVAIKIHPAIAFARVANNDDYYVFGTTPSSYKSNGVMKRQAVQFRLFAYGDNHVGLGELTAGVMEDLDITAVWSARVANRKIARLEGTPLGWHRFRNLCRSLLGRRERRGPGRIVARLRRGRGDPPGADHFDRSVHSAQGAASTARCPERRCRHTPPCRARSPTRPATARSLYAWSRAVRR